MQPRRNYSLTKRIFGLGLASLVSLSHAAPLIVLPAGEITRLSYVGQEFFDDKNGNHLPDRGDVFKGVVNITQIHGVASGADFSSQLADNELTGRFHFSIIDQSSDFSHLEFGLLPGDFFNFYVGQGSTKNFDPSASNVYDRASDGQFWLGLKPGGVFESVNDRQSNGSTLNRAWADITVNNTGYFLHSDLLRTILGKDAQHRVGSQFHGDHSTQAIFDNQVAGASSFPSQFTFNIFGEFDVFAVPEPPTPLLILLGMTIGLSFRRCGNMSRRLQGRITPLNAAGSS
jgi:PEP-CTERM putative exosortase interaction domain